VPNIIQVQFETMELQAFFEELSPKENKNKIVV